MGGSNSKGVEWLERVNIKDGFNLDECKKLWVSYDRNKSNILDSKEVEAFCQDYAKAQRITERCKVQALTFDFINTFDLDGSGSIDWKELGTQTSESYIQTTPSCAAPRWSKCALDGPAPSSRNSHKAVMLGDLCIIFGGRKGSSRRNTNEILIQDYVSMQWFRPELVQDANAPTPKPREDHAMAIFDRDLYIFGGNHGGGKLAKDMWTFSLDKLCWTLMSPAGDVPKQVSGHTMCHWRDPEQTNNKDKGSLLVFGGSNDNGSSFLNTITRYDISKNEYKIVGKSKAPLARALHTADVIDGKLVVFGGKGALGCFNDLCVYDPTTDSWASPNLTGVFPAGRCGHSTVVVGQKLFVFGGWNGTFCFNDLHMFDMEALRWSRIVTCGERPPGRTYHSSVCRGAKIYLFGGRDDSRRMDDTYMLDLTSLIAPSQLSPFASASASASAFASASDTTKPSEEIKGITRARDRKVRRTKTELRSSLVLSSLKKANDKPKQPNKLGKYTVTKDDFSFRETLGTGSFGRVRLCSHRATNKYFAIKILKKEAVLRLKQVDHILNEKSILCRIDHPFIVNLRSYFQDSRNLYFVLDYIAGGEFFSHLRKSRRFEDKHARFYAAHIVLIFEYLHDRDIVYRDLKPENLLIDEKGYLKVTDFGFAKKVETRTWTLCGTPEYIAPEILLNKGHGKPVDWWALGVLIYEMLAGSPPFVDDSPIGIYQKILDAKEKLRFSSRFHVHAQDLIRKLLEPDISRRLGNLKEGVRAIKEHPWFKTFSWNGLVANTLPAPWVPQLKGGNDTTNFDSYPESDGEAPEISMKDDPFKDF